MLHEAIFLATCNATMTNKKPFKLQRGSVSHVCNLSRNVAKSRGSFYFSCNSQHNNRPRSIYQYSNMAPRLSGQNCKFFKFLLSLNSQKRLEYKENNTKYRHLLWKARSHFRLLLYRGWPIEEKYWNPSCLDNLLSPTNALLISQFRYTVEQPFVTLFIYIFFAVVDAFLFNLRKRYMANYIT